MFALVDCNNFFVSCERVFNPKLKNKPVLVMSNNDGCIVSRSQEVKNIGIPMAAPVFKYKDVISRYKIHTFSANFSLYGDMSARVMSTVGALVPDMEIYSIDEAFLDMGGLQGKDLDAYARLIKKRVYKWTGIPISVGIASTKTLAKAASDLAKKNLEFNGVLEFSHRVDYLLARLPVEDVWGIGPAYSAMLKSNNVHTAAELKYANQKWIKKRLHLPGLQTVMELNNISCVNLESRPAAKKGITTSRTFGKPINTFHELRQAVSVFISRAAEKAREQKSAVKHMNIYIKNSPYKQTSYFSNSIGMSLNEPTNYTPALTSAAHHLLKKIYKSGIEYKKAGVLFTELIDENFVQMSLFRTGFPERSNAAMRALDRINEEWGTDTVYYASMHHLIHKRAKRKIQENAHRSWFMSQKNRSRAFTTDWKQLPVALA